MHFEVRWGEQYRIIEAGNQFTACMELVREAARDNEPIQMDMFTVIPLDAEYPEPQEISLATILSVMLLIQPEDEECEERMTAQIQGRHT